MAENKRVLNHLRFEGLLNFEKRIVNIEEKVFLHLVGFLYSIESKHCFRLCLLSNYWNVSTVTVNDKSAFVSSVLNFTINFVHYLLEVTKM